MATLANSYGPYDTGAGANITEAFWRLMTRWFAPNAVLANYLNELAPFGDSTGLQAKVNTGGALIRGAYGEWTSTVTQGLASVGAIAGGSERYDRLVVRNDFVANTMVIDVLTGPVAAAPNASRPALTQTTSMWEYHLADVGPLNNATSTVTAAMVLDGRWKISETGILYHEASPSGVSSIILPGSGVIPPGRHLLAEWVARTSTAAAADLYLQFNGDTAANYSFQQLFGTGGAVTFANPTAGQAQGNIGQVPGSTFGGSTVFGSGSAKINHFASTLHQRITRAESAYLQASSATSLHLLRSMYWSGAGAIATILAGLSTGNYVAGSLFTLSVLP